MAKKLDKKKQVVDKYKDKVQNSKAVFFFNGSLTAVNTTDIKSTLSQDAKLTLLKNSLFNIACKEASVELKITGYNNAIFVNDKIIENALGINKFVSENQFNFTYALIGNTIYPGEKVKEIAKLGSESQVYGKLVSIVSTPATLLVRDLQSPIQKLVYTLSQIKN